MPIPNLELVLSQYRKGEAVILLAVSKKETPPENPDPDIPPDPTVHVTTLLEELRHKALPEPVTNPAKVRAEFKAVLPVTFRKEDREVPEVTVKDPPIPTLPVVCSWEVGEIVPMPTLPFPSMVIPEVAVPPVIKPILFAPIRYSPVSVSLVKVKPGAAAVPSANLTTPPAVNVPLKEMESFKEMVAEEPKVISPPPVRLVPAVTVILLLLRAELGMLVKVLLEPDMDLLVKV